MTRRLAVRLAAGVLGVLLPAAAQPAQKPRPEDRVLPNFDIRASVQGARAAPDAAADAALDRLLQGAGRSVRVRPGARGDARVVAAHGRALSAPASGSPEAIARRFLSEHHRAFGLDRDDLDTLLHSRTVGSRTDPLVHVTYRQALGGLRVFGAELRVHLTRAGEVVRVTTSVVPARRDLGSPLLGPDAAARAALAHVRPELSGIELRARPGPRGPARRVVYERGPLASDIDVQLVAFPMTDGLRLAWQVVVEPTGLPQKYDVLIDALTGELLYRRNRVLYAEGTGRVLQSDATRSRDARLPDEAPTGAGTPGPFDPPSGCPPVTNHVPRSLASPFRDAATVLAASGRLQGNNAHVFRGAVGIEGALGAAQPDGSWLFDFDFGSPGSAETHLFFLSNYLHDFFYDLGFDEDAGNFQSDNFGRGGAGGDPLFVLARADGRNNATFEPRPDGQSPIMSMFLWDGSGCWSSDVDGDGWPDLDGAFDADIVIHEFHHGVNHRLNTAFTGDEADAIGEGGSDFFAYSLNGDPQLAEYSYPPSGIRRVNGRTYGSWSCWFGFICEPHDNGEIWANALWDLRERFRADAVGGSDEAALGAAHLLYVDGLRLSPPSPTMLDLRDAMLQADVLRRPSGDPGGSVNACRIWEVFALRGMGQAARDTSDTGTLNVVEDFSMPSECPALPPPATVTITASDASASETGPDPGAFTIARSGDTTRALIVYLGAPAGSAIEGEDYLVLPGEVTIPAGASAADVVLTPVDDLAVEGAETATLALAPGVGYRAGSPASATVTITSDDVIPDLLVYSLTGPPTAGAGASLTVTETTRNQGTGAADTSTTRFHLSVNSIVDAGDVVIGSRSVGPLAAGASSTASVVLNIPPGTVAGNYYVVAQADADLAIAESNESNNLRALFVRVGPDLRVTSISAPATGAPGATITVSDTTRNEGAGAAAASVTGFFLSANPTLDASDVALGSRNVPALAAGASSASSLAVPIPAGTAAGSYYIISRADSGDQVAETLETNNVASAFIRIGPDLTVAGVTVSPGVAGAGSAVSVTDTTRNTGGGAAPASSTRLYLSANTVLDAADALLGSRAVPSLAAGASNAGSTTVVIPPATPTGTYYVLAQADGPNEVVETTETNNLANVRIVVGADLTVGPFTASPTAMGAGGATVVSDTTKNAGGSAASASTTRFYLSSNSVVDAADVPLGSRAVPPLAAGASSAGSTTLTIPGGTAAGTYYLLAQADGAGEVVETTETNNLASVTIRVGPDLIVGSLAASPIATGPGLQVTVSDTTRNGGGGAAPASTTRFYLSANGALDSSDALVGGRAVPALGAGVTSSAATAITMPGGVPAGTWYLLARADDEAAVGEVTETNNLASVTLRVGADLIAASLTAPATIPAGVAFTLTDDTRNQGGAAAPASTTRFHLSVNATADAADVVLGSRLVPALAAGGTHAASSVLVVPEGTSPGKYYLVQVVDADGEVPEVYETNNTRVVLVTVQ